ncbi:MAG TPA: TraR/DksA C4-type zinc finger protein [Candidatus Dormibacteraeota bacterium]|nr:TraR/DksA C4-type zinc finger protein [Candidatus Dormibacteraeota bacterium]
MPTTTRNAPTPTKAPQRNVSEVEKQLASIRKELSAKLQEHRAGVLIEREPDDEGAAASQSLNRHLTVSILERENDTLEEIDRALKRLRTGEYGICEICDQTIAEARLKALPWTRFCIQCADRI